MIVICGNKNTNHDNTIGWGFGIPSKKLLGRQFSPQTRNDVVLLMMDGRNPVPADMVVYPIIYRVSYMSDGAGFLPSTVSYRDSHIPKSHRDISEEVVLQGVM